jgi:predicted NAD/FAD-binding protein
MRIAVIGAGVSGLGAAYLLRRAHEVEVFEREPQPGGDVRTIEHFDGGRQLALDTGFIVHNRHNYPLLTRLFGELGVRTQPAEMSFSVSCRRCALEYSGRRPFAQRRNLADPRFLALLAEIGRWLRGAERTLERGAARERTLGRYVTEQRYSRRFRDHFLIPFASALWSSAPQRALDIPAEHALRFFANHGMLGLRRPGSWLSVSGGARSYVRALGARLDGRLCTSAPVRAVVRTPDGVELRTADDAVARFDQVVIATHADQALALLTDPSPDERRLLGAFPYVPNEAVLHTDEALLPRARTARASWNYRLDDCGDPPAGPTVTYYLNKLQALDGERHYCVTLNRGREIAPEQVIARLDFRHPVYTLAALRAQAELGRLGGGRRTHFAGAYHGYGFHEDGLASGVRAAAALGVEW